jgi:hypothetical protein
MPLHADEAAFIRAFILPERQERWQFALASEKHRGKTLHRLADSRDFRTDRMTALDRTLASGEAIWKHLASVGAKETCHVISEIEDLDGRDMPTPAALEECVDSRPPGLFRGRECETAMDLAVLKPIRSSSSCCTG